MWAPRCRPPGRRASVRGAALLCCVVAAGCSSSSPMDGGIVLRDGAPSDVPPAPVGEPCTADTDCISGICLRPPLGQRCARECDVSPSSCSTGELCSPVMIATADGSPTTVAACVPANLGKSPQGERCESDEDCESWACLDGLCSSSCAGPDDCLPGLSCEIVDGARACTPPSAPTGVRVDLIDLGTHTLTTDADPTGITLAVPEDALGVTFRARRVGGDDVAFGFFELLGPEGALLFDVLDELSEGNDQPLRWLPVRPFDAIGMLLPNSTPDRLRLERGRHELSLGATVAAGRTTGTAEVEVSALVKRSTGDAGSSFDLNVFLVGVGTTVATADQDERLVAVLDEIGRIFEAVGIGVGRIRFFDVDAERSARLADLDASSEPGGEDGELFALSPDDADPAVNLFLVRSIRDEGGPVLGTSSGIPGPMGLHGTANSGVAASFDPVVVGDDTRVPAQVAAHEIGHFFGLFHSREAGTPCREGTLPSPGDPCAPFGGGDVLEDTSRTDGTNLMYFAFGGDDGSTYNASLSEGQAFVITRSPLVR